MRKSGMLIEIGGVSGYAPGAEIEQSQKAGRMEVLIPIGAVISVVGLIGLVICILRATRIRREGGSDDVVREKIQKLVALNMGSLFLSVVGLMFVVVGILLS